MDVTLWIGALVIGYLFGSIPFGLVITRLAGLGDIRAIGSGNIGATNVLRTGRKDLALATLLLDSGKAGLACLLCGWGARLILEAGAAPAELADAPFRTGLTAGAAAFVGHCFPVWLRFRGGKGVATFIGLLLAAMWQVGLIFALTWLATAAAFRMSSLAALIAAVLAPVSVFLMGYGPFAVTLTSALVALILWLHRANISRILSGSEPRIGARKTG